MKIKISWIVFSLVVAGFGFYGTASADVIDKIVAIVNNDIITLVQLNKEVAPYIKNIESSGYPDDKKKEMLQDLNQKMLDAMIDSSLTQQEAKRYNINVSETEIDKAVENVKQAKSISQEDFERVLAQDGRTMKEYRENVRRQILQARLINTTVKSKVIITESDIKKQYEADAEKYAGQKKYHLRNILLDNEDKIREIKNRLDKKEDFTLLAQQYSMASNAVDGGDLGLFDISNFSETIKESIAKLKKEDYTDIISTPQGFQIFYVEDIVLDGSKTYEQAYEDIHESLYREQVEKKFKTWFESLKKKAHIKIML